MSANSACGRKSASRSPKPATRGRPRSRSGGAENVKLLAIDSDGVLIDGHLVFNPAGEIMQRFSIYDGYGIECALSAGVEVAMLTGLRGA